MAIMRLFIFSRSKYRGNLLLMFTRTVLRGAVVFVFPESYFSEREKIRKEPASFMHEHRNAWRGAVDIPCPGPLGHLSLPAAADIPTSLLTAAHPKHLRLTLPTGGGGAGTSEG